MTWDEESERRLREMRIARDLEQRAREMQRQQGSQSGSQSGDGCFLVSMIILLVLAIGLVML